MKPPKCPNCKSTNVGVIFWGYPLVKNKEQFEKDLASGKIHLGGCCISDDDPKWHCNSCKNEFGSRFHTLDEL
jgi:transposase-like protein